MPAELIAARTAEWAIIKFFSVIAHNYIIILTNIEKRLVVSARMVELADTRDLKSLGQQCPCEFESHFWY